MSTTIVKLPTPMKITKKKKRERTETEHVIETEQKQEWKKQTVLRRP